MTQKPLLNHLTLQCRSRFFEFPSNSQRNSRRRRCSCDDDALRKLISVITVYTTSAYSSERVDHTKDWWIMQWYEERSGLSSLIWVTAPFSFFIMEGSPSVVMDATWENAADVILLLCRCNSCLKTASVTNGSWSLGQTSHPGVKRWRTLVVWVPVLIHSHAPVPYTIR